MTTDAAHFNQPQQRKAEFIKPPNRLKNKVGNGGLENAILEKAQALLENNTVDFQPLAEMHLDVLTEAIDNYRNGRVKGEDAIEAIILPAMQLKAKGSMFGYPLITSIGDNLVNFLEVIIRLDNDAADIITAHKRTMRLIASSRITGAGGKQGAALQSELREACSRYFSKHMHNRAQSETDPDIIS